MITQIAQTLEDAADLILMRGLYRGGSSHDWNSDRYCTIGAIYQVATDGENGRSIGGVVCDTLEQYLRSNGAVVRPNIEGQLAPLASWSDESPDDFVVIDALRHCAKDLRNNG